jgi:hypothetical protein
VHELGWIHPKGESYTASLFTLDDDRTLYAQSRLFGMKQKYEWLEYDLEGGSAKNFPFEVNEPSLPPLGQALLYGSMAQDFNGNFYVAGTFYGKQIPLLLKVSLER